MNEKRSWLYDLLFILVLLMAGYLRLAGFNWGEGYHQHPDELFLTGVLDNLRAHVCEDPLVPVDACPPDQQRWMIISEYFDSSTSEPIQSWECFLCVWQPANDFGSGRHGNGCKGRHQ